MGSEMCIRDRPELAAPETTVPQTTVPETTEPPAPAPVGDSNQRLAGQFDTLAGQTINLADFHNQDVVLWMWAPW